MLALIVLFAVQLASDSTGSVPGEVADAPAEIESAPQGAADRLDVARQVMALAGRSEVAELFAPDAEISSSALEYAGGLDEWLQLQAWAAAIGGEWSDVECTTSTTQGDAVCTYRHNSAIETSNGVEPSMHERVFAVEDGLVTRQVETTLETSVDEQAAFGDFFAWLFETHPEDADRMVSTDGNYTPVVQENVIPLWERYTAEYVDYRAFVSAEDVMRRIIELPGRPIEAQAAQVLFSPNADIEGIDSVDSPADWAAYHRYHEVLG